MYKLKLTKTRVARVQRGSDTVDGLVETVGYKIYRWSLTFCIMDVYCREDVQL